MAQNPVQSPASNVVIYIVADESRNAGERDYAMGLFKSVAEEGLPEDTVTLTFKVPPQDPAKRDEALGRGREPQGLLPLDKEIYAAIPVYPGVFSALAGYALPCASVKVVGAGHSTLAAVREIGAELEKMPQVRNAGLSYISHMVDGAEHMREVVSSDVHLFLAEPTTPAHLAALDAEAAAKLKVTFVDSVPGTNDDDVAAGLAVEGVKYRAVRDAGYNMFHVAESPGNFAVAVVNAGFPVKDKRFPYTLAEAREQGALFAQHLMAHGVERVILCEGGPRNGNDRDQIEGAALAALKDACPAALFNHLAGQTKAFDPFTVFRESMERAMEKAGAPLAEVYEERFVKGAPCNSLNTALHIAATHENCKVVLSNSEGWGTMATAAQVIDNARTSLCMFDFAANHEDKTFLRDLNTQLYHRRGFDLLEAGPDGALCVVEHPHKARTPIRIENGRHRIAAELGLTAKTAPAPARVAEMKSAP